MQTLIINSPVRHTEALMAHFMPHIPRRQKVRWRRNSPGLNCLCPRQSERFHLVRLCAQLRSEPRGSMAGSLQPTHLLYRILSHNLLLFPELD